MSQHAPAAQAADVEDAEGIARRCCRQIPRAGHQPLSGSTELERLLSIARAVPRDAPANLVEVARLMADCDMDYQFQLGLDLIIAGLEVRLQVER